MKIAVFYENIHEGAQAAGRQIEEVLTELRDAGMELLYLTPDSWKKLNTEHWIWVETMFCPPPASPQVSESSRKNT